MRRVSFAADSVFDFDGRRYRLADRSPRGDWQAIDVETGVLTAWSWERLGEAYEAGHLTLVPVGRAAVEAQRMPVSEVSDERRRVAQQRLEFLDRVARRRAGRALDRGELAELLAEVSADIGLPQPVSVATFYRWKGKAEQLGAAGLIKARRKRRGRQVQGAAICRQVMLEALVAAKQNRRVGIAPVATLKSMRLRAARLIAEENARRAALGDRTICKVPSPSTFNRMWNDLPAEDRAVARVGKVEAARLFRGGSGAQRPAACLDRVEYDETQVPIFVFDEHLGVPLGRPWLAWYVDVYSAAPIGFYLGFENPSDLTIASALRHCCLPKAYVAREYPTIENTSLPAGVPRHVVFDNGLAQWGATIEQLAFDLDMSISYTRPRTPWFKGRVEGMFETLNRTLLRELPGFVLAKDMHEYDPQKHGCIGLRHFLYVLHAWLADVYLQEPQGILMQSPARLWEEGTSQHPPSFVPRSQDLDLLFGIKRPGRLDHRGVRYANLYFHSPELHDLRRRYGDRLAVEVKVDPSNLAAVHVRAPKADSGWVRAEAALFDYARNLSLHRHQLNLKNAREHFGEVSAASLQRAQQRLHELIADALPAALSIRSSSLIARTLGIGTQHIVNNIGHDGHLTSLTGPFAGERLNPWADSEVGTTRPPAGPPRGEEPDLQAGPARVRPRRTFAGDHSLGGLDE